MSGKKKKSHEKDTEEEVKIYNAQEEKTQNQSVRIQEQSMQSQPPSASAELYAQLEAQLRTLRAELEKMQEELQKIRDRRGSLDRRFYRELLDSEVLGQIAACYVEARGKKELYGNIRKFLEEHEEQCHAIRAELRASRERSRNSGGTSLACAAGILSVAGVVYAAVGMASGAVIVLFLVLIAFSGYVWVSMERMARINGCAEYVLTVMEDIENSKKL